jgi:hypothetical protein
MELAAKAPWGDGRYSQPSGGTLDRARHIAPMLGMEEVNGMEMLVSLLAVVYFLSGIAYHIVGIVLLLRKIKQ